MRRPSSRRALLPRAVESSSQGGEATMSSHDRRAAGRRRAWGRGPIILRFEPLEGRQLLAATPAAATPPAPLPDLVGQSFQTPLTLEWGGTFHAQGVVVNHGTAAVSTPFKVDIYASP